MKHGSTTVKVRIEVVPSHDLADKLQDVYKPPGAVSVTCLPHHGPEKTVTAAVELAGLGYRVIPHLAARSIGSRTELLDDLQRLQAAGISEIFAIAGDRQDPAGPYSWSGILQQEILTLGQGFTVGIAGYPEGHPEIPNQTLNEALQFKAPHASALVTQICLDPETTAAYVSSLRQNSITTPVWIGVPGPVTPSKLVAMGARLGVGRSLKLASKTGLIKLLRPGHPFNSAQLIKTVSDVLADDPLIEGFHIYTFNDLTRLPKLLAEIHRTADDQKSGKHKIRM